MTVEKSVIINVEADDANKELEKFDKNLKESNETTQELNNSLNTMTGGAVAGFTKVFGIVKKTITGMKSLKVAIASTGIGLLVVAIGSLATAFKASEEGQNRFSKLMTQIGVVTGNVLDIFANIGEALYSVGEALVRLAKGDLKGAKESWSEFKNEVKETTDAVKNFGKETRKEVEQGAKVADMRAKADKIERDLLVDRAKMESQIAELRLKARESDRFSADERMKFLKESEKIADQLLAREEEALKLRFEAQKLENTFSRSNKENLDKEAEAEAQLYRVQTRRYTEQKALIRELDRVRNEIFSAEQARRKEEERIRDEELKEAEEWMDAEIKREMELADALLEIDIDLTKKRVEESQKAVKEKMKQAEEAQNYEVGLASQTSMLIGAIIDKDSKIGKGVAVASAVISGYESVQNAFTTAQKSPITAINPSYPFIQAGIAGAFSLLQLNKIKSSDPTGRSGAGGGGSVGGGASAPSFNLVQGTGTNQIAQGLNQSNSPSKAYVVTSDVSSGQELDRKIVEGASI